MRKLGIYFVQVPYKVTNMRFLMNATGFPDARVWDQKIGLRIPNR